MYTTLRFKLKLRKDAPDYVSQYLEVMADSDKLFDDVFAVKRLMPEEVQNHVLFSTDRWHIIFSNCTNLEWARCLYDPTTGLFDIVASIKAYQSIVDKFMGFLYPYLDASYENLSYTIYEDSENRCVVQLGSEEAVKADYDSIFDFGFSSGCMELDKDRANFTAYISS